VARDSDRAESSHRGRQLDQLIDSLISELPTTPSILCRHSSRSRNGRLKAALLLSLAITLSLVTLLGVIPLWGSGCSPNPTRSAGSKSIALIDSLAVDSPNPGLVENISSLTNVAGYSLDYYPAVAVTVDLF